MEKLGLQVDDEVMEMIKKDDETFDFWKSAKKEVKIAIRFSYLFKKLNTEKNKVGNVEIDYAWPDDKLHQKHVGVRSFLKVLMTFNLSLILDEIVIRGGTHLKGLRYKRIHLVVDRIKGRVLYGVHVDSRYPSFLSIDAIKHLVLDDITS